MHFQLYPSYITSRNHVSPTSSTTPINLRDSTASPQLPNRPTSTNAFHTMTTSQTTILLLGAGELGTAFLPHLSKLSNIHITLGVRNPPKYTHLTSPIVSISQIDLASPSRELAETFAEHDILISATGFGADPSTVLKLANEVLAAGMLRQDRGQASLWYFPWQWGVDYDVTGDGNGLMPLFGAQRHVRTLLRKQALSSNVKWTVVSTAIFMSFLFEQFWGIVDRSLEAESGNITVRCLRDWDHKVTVTDVNDIGRVLARIIASPSLFTNNILYVAGDTVLYAELASIVERVSGATVEMETWDVPHLERELSNSPDNGIKKYRLVFARDGVWWDKEKTINHELGMPMMDVATYADRLFNKGSRGE
ncbi:NAD(P)-binding protein [Clathrospora elynae]|uniref:NAD(P)-binding protein n=1 Tax=Clathrospora elynae TaxID=706981 RepID=A0A6A5S282_9PLEO|nr:NAD(P)-binding protein [Clathrospora elynae]